MRFSMFDHNKYTTNHEKTSLQHAHALSLMPHAAATPVVIL